MVIGVIIVILLGLVWIFIASGFNDVGVERDKVFVDEDIYTVESVDEMLWVSGTCSIIGRFKKDDKITNIVAFRCGFVKYEKIKRRLKDNLKECGIECGRL